MKATFHTLIAVDIAKHTLQCQSPEQTWSLDYQPEVLNRWVQSLRTLGPLLVVCEATGGYERLLLQTLHHADIPVCVVNPRRVRAFATSEGVRAKTDPIDARILLRFAQEKKLHPTPPPHPAQQALAAWVDRRHHLTDMLTEEKNRLQNSPVLLHSSIRQMIGRLEHQLQAVEAKITGLVAAHEDLQRMDQILQSICGVGSVTAWTLMAFLSEISSLGRNQLVALAGLAPFNRDSGRFRGKRSIQGGRAKVRKCLYMAAQTAARHNPVIRDYVARLRQRGKPYKCAMVAAMRKLLIHIQSLLKQHNFALAS